MPTTLDAATRRALRARAHHLDPVVAIGQHGLTPAVVHEIDVALQAHELIKVRVLGDDRAARSAMLGQIASAVNAAPVQQLGKLLVLWRPNPDKDQAKRRATGTARNRKRPAGIDDPRKKAADKNTGARGKQSKAGARKRGSGAAAASAQARERRRRADAEAGAPEPAPRGRARPAPTAAPPGGDDRRPAGPPASKGRPVPAAATRGRPAPPAGVPRAAQPRRRRAR